MVGLAFEDRGAGVPLIEGESAAAIIEEAEMAGEGPYRAVLHNLGFMWRWRIYREDEMCQEGCSLSENSSREAVRHVLAFYKVRDADGHEDGSG